MTIEYLRGNAVFPDRVAPALITIDVEKGTIQAVDPCERKGSEKVLIFPGFVDAHVHAREYPLPVDADTETFDRWQAMCEKETFATAVDAAINGGVTLFGAMPNDPEPPDNEQTYRAKQALAAHLPCPVVVFGLVTSRSAPWADIPYKVYLDGWPSKTSFHEWRDLEEVLPRFRGCRVFFHAEDPETLRAHGNGGFPRWQTRPPEAESIAVERILSYTARWGLHTHICHISTKGAAMLIEEYNRSATDQVTSEVTPHHVFFSVVQGMIRSATGTPHLPDFFFECNPPLRSEEHRVWILEALREGIVSILASDHAPHTAENKRKGAAGMPHLDTLGAFVGWLIGEMGFSPARVADILSSGPARLFAPDLDYPHGMLCPGAVASFSVLDVSGVTLVRENSVGNRTLGTRCAWSPFAGISFPAKVVRTIVKGKDLRDSSPTGEQPRA